MTSLTADETLVDGLRAGRRDAFERLYTDYNAAIYNLCARILGDREEAKDVTQEVFIKAFNQLPTAGEQSLKLRPWLFRVATNACFNHLRAQKHLGAGHDAELAEMPSPVDGFAQAQTVALVEATLGQLSDRYRTALVLKDLHGLPPEEIATVMDVSRPTADVLVHRARSSFKSIFAKLAGEGAAAPASLALVLVPLALPAALHLVPPTPHVTAPAHVPAPSTHGSGGSLLSKLAPVAASKVAVAAVAASLVVGGVAIKQLTSTGHHAVAAHVAAVVSRSNRSSAAAHQGYLSWSMRWGWQEWSRWGGSGRLMQSQMSWYDWGGGTTSMTANSRMGSSGSSTGMSATNLSGSSPSSSRMPGATSPAGSPPSAGGGMSTKSYSTGSASGGGMSTKSYSTGSASGSGTSTMSPTRSSASGSGTSTMTSTTSSISGSGM